MTENLSAKGQEDGYRLCRYGHVWIVNIGPFGGKGIADNELCACGTIAYKDRDWKKSYGTWFEGYSL